MAAQVKLVRRRDFGSDVSSLSLFNYEDGISLTRDGWIPAVARDGDESVAEAMTFRLEGSNHDDLASILQSLDDKIEEVGWYNDAAERYSVWIRTQLPDESGARQVMIRQAGGEIGSAAFAPPLSPGNALREYYLALERMPWWEATQHTICVANTISCLGGIYDYAGIGGNRPGRIAQTAFRGAVGGGGPLDEFWLGFRTDRFGDRSNFAPLWECEDGSLTNDTDVHAAATASGGSCARCTFGDESLLTRVQIAVEDATTDYDDQRGRFNVLLRAKVGAATTARVRLQDGFEQLGDWRPLPRVEIEATDWTLFPLGSVTMPPGQTILPLQNFALRLQAERVSGSGNLFMDCLVFIPSAEGALHITGGAVTYSLGDQRPSRVYVHPNGKIEAWSYIVGGTGEYVTQGTVAVEPEKYELPTGGCLLILAGQRATIQDKDDYVDLRLYLFSRYRTLRGAG